MSVNHLAKWHRKLAVHLVWCTILTNVWSHYGDVIMGTIVSQITSLTIVYSVVYSGADQRKHQRSASLAFVSPMASNAENISLWWRRHEDNCLLYIYESMGIVFVILFPFSKGILVISPKFIMVITQHCDPLWISKLWSREQMADFVFLWIQMKLFTNSWCIELTSSLRNPSQLPNCWALLTSLV